MWKNISKLILGNRILIIISIILFTIFFGFFATKLKLQYQLNKLLPESDPVYIAYEDFKSNFGQDGLMLVIATNEPDFYKEDKFNAWLEMADSIQNVKVLISNNDTTFYKNVVDSVFSEAHLYNITKNKNQQRFNLVEIIDDYPLDQNVIDSVKQVISSLKFYENIVYKKSTDLHMMMLFLNKEIFNSKLRGTLVSDIHNIANSYNHHFKNWKFSGLPYIRAFMMNVIKSELTLFVCLAILVTSLLLLIFFKSLKVVLISIVVVLIGVVWSVGIIGLFGYELTALMALIPPLVIVIGIPNCIYLINKYQQEFRKNNNKIKSLELIIQKVGNATFLTNATTALGFGTFVFTSSKMMIEFGIVSFINIICMFFISICLVPIVYSFLPDPKEKHIKHLDRKWMYSFVSSLIKFSKFYRKQVYISTFILLLLGGYGISLMHTTGNFTDDLPKNSPIIKDLRFFEKELNGVLPFEIVLTFQDTMYKNFSNISRIQQLQESLKKEKYLSKSLSIVDAMKFISQSYANGKSSKYNLDFSRPKDQRYFSRIISSKYFKNTFVSSETDNSNGFVGSFLDSTHLSTRITLQIADIGTSSMDSLINRINFRIDNIINPEQSLISKHKQNNDLYGMYSSNSRIRFIVKEKLTNGNLDLINSFPDDYKEIKSLYGNENFTSAIEESVESLKVESVVTGSGVLYTKGTTYMVKNLFTSLILAIFVIAILMSFLFKSFKMVLVSLFPNLIPLIFTSALMGYFGIAIKPSTILVFSIAFGISIDDTIHFLAKYRQELKTKSISDSVEVSIKETGVSMIYTSIILFFGFSMFTASKFGGTQALGVLVSLTLFVAMLTNLILLPSLLLSLEQNVITKSFKNSEDYFYDDSDIELDKL
ncbi:MAG: transporter [Crocinitomicaceae bacterium]|nr:transporter [Crocinitomicaceae bacterium]